MCLKDTVKLQKIHSALRRVVEGEVVTFRLPLAPQISALSSLRSHADQLLCRVGGRPGRKRQVPERRLRQQPAEGRPAGGALHLLLLHGGGGPSRRGLPVQGRGRHGRLHLQPEQAAPGPGPRLLPLARLHPLHPALPHAPAKFSRR